MRAVLGLVLVATLTAVPTAGGRQEATVTAAELRAYLGKVGAVAPRYVQWKGNAWRAVQVASIAWQLDDPETTAGMVRTLRRAERELTPLAARMAKVAAPGDLRPLHSSFTRSITTETRCTGRVATVVENGGNPETAAGNCTQAFVGTTERQKHWRTEITVAARRLGVVLPFWVKKVGVHPK
jgi:hypothetical protein